MAIMVRKQGGRWNKTEKIVFADEAQLQKMFYESPELIPTRIEDQAAVFTREAGLPGSGSTDLVGVPKSGALRGSIAPGTGFTWSRGARVSNHACSLFKTHTGS